jgi:hypothetical protein
METDGYAFTVMRSSMSSQSADGRRGHTEKARPHVGACGDAGGMK